MGEDSIVIKAYIDTSGIGSGLNEIKERASEFAKAAREAVEEASKSATESAKSAAENMESNLGGGFERLKKEVREWGEAAREGFSMTAEAAADAGGAIAKGLGSVYKFVGKGLLSATQSVTKELGNIGKSAVKYIGGGITKAATGAVGVVKKFGGTVLEVAKNRFPLLGRGASDSMKSVQGGFQSAFQMAKRMIPMIIGVRSAFSVLQKGASAYLSQNKQLQGQLNACWTAIGNVIGPIIEMLVNLLSTLISYLITFLHLIGLSSKSASDSAKKTSGAAKSMQKSLMGFDELNKLQDNSGGGGGGSGSLTDPQLPEALQDLIAALKQLWETIQTAWKNAWEKYGQGLKDSLKQTLEDALKLVTDIVLRIDEAFNKDGNLQKFFENLLLTVTNISNAVDAIIKAIDDWVNTTDWFNRAFAMITEISGDVAEMSRILSEEIAPLIADKVQPWLDAIANGIYTALTNIDGILKNINDLLADPVGQKAIQDLLDLNIAIQEVNWATINFILGVIKNLDLKELAADVSAIATNATGFLGSLTDLLTNEGVSDTATTIGQMFLHIAGQGIASVFKNLTNLVNAIGAYSWTEFNEVLQNSRIEVSENIITALDNLFATIGTVVFTGVNLFLETFKNIDWKSVSSSWSVISYSLRTAAEKLKDFLGNETVAKCLAKIYEIFTSVVGTTLTTIFDSLGTLIDSFANANWNDIYTALDNIKNALTLDDPVEIGTSIGNFLNTAMENVPWDTIGSLLWTNINKAISTTLALVEATDFQALGTDIGTFISNGIQQIDWEGLGSAIGTIIGDAIGFVSSMLASVDGTDLASAFTGFTDNLLTAIKDAITKVNWTEVGTQIGNFFKELWADRSELFNAVWDLAMSIADALVDLIWGALVGDKAPEYREKVKSALKTLLSPFKGIFNMLFGIDEYHVNASEEDKAAIAAEAQAAGAEAGELATKAYIDSFLLAAEQAIDQAGGMQSANYGQKLAEYMGAESNDYTTAFDRVKETVLADLERWTAINGPEFASTYWEKFASFMNSEGYSGDADYWRGVFENGIDAAADAGEEAGDNFISSAADSIKGTDGHAEIQNAFGDMLGDVIDGVPIDKDKLKELGNKQGEVIAEGINESTASNIDFTEEAESEAANNLLVIASRIQNAEEAQSVGESIVKGLLHGMSLEMPNLVTGIETGITTVLGAADTVYTTWRDQTFIPNRDSFLTEFTTWLNGAFYTDIITNSLENTLISGIQTDLDNCLSDIKQKLLTAGTEIETLFRNLASHARNWGYDIGLQIAKGIFDSLDVVRAAAKEVALVIKSYLGFSEPDIGPLSNFHTFMPDMMQLMAQGIMQNEDKPASALDAVAQRMADSMMMLNQLDGIANNVAFQMPAMATGGIMPYSVGGGNSKDDMRDYMDNLYSTFLQAMTVALNNANAKPFEAHLYLDGKEIAENTTKWQRRTDRAGGR